MIQILWPTVRPEKMLKTLDRWLEDASGKHDIRLNVAVNTAEDAECLASRHGMPNILITGTERRGPVWPVYRLGQDLINVKAMCHDDIVIVVSDDFLAFTDWDKWLEEKMCIQSEGYKAYHPLFRGLMVNDGYQCRDGRAMTLPIMTFGALKALNGIIYHPEYNWQFCDNELFENLTALGILKEARDNGPTFRHEHWITGHRQKDAHDLFGDEKSAVDRATFERRMKLPLAERLIV